MANSPAARVRDAQLDNCKFLLIFLMVLGHFFETYRGDSPLIAALFGWIYFFHMGAFCFFSGYVSKDPEKCRRTAVERFLVPYVLFNFLSYLSIDIIAGRVPDVTGFRLFFPHSSMWFLFALFVWKILLPDLLRVRWAWPVSLVLAVLVGFFPRTGAEDSYTRVVTFLPFFLAGYYCRAEQLDRVRRIPKLCGVGIVAVTAALAAVFFGILELPAGILYHSHSYAHYDIGLTGWTALFAGAGLRIVCFATGAALIAALLILMPRRDGLCARLGQNTMTVYLLHFFVVRALRRVLPEALEPWQALALCLALSVVLTLALSWPPLTRGYGAAMRWVRKCVFRQTY